MGHLDLDAQRAEANETPHTVVLAGQEWTLPARFPLLAGARMQSGDVEDAIALLFGEDAVPVLAPVFTAEDLEAIADQLYDLNAKADRVGRGAVSNGNRALRRAAAN